MMNANVGVLPFMVGPFLCSIEHVLCAALWPLRLVVFRRTLRDSTARCFCGRDFSRSLLAAVVCPGPPLMPSFRVQSGAVRLVTDLDPVCGSPPIVWRPVLAVRLLVTNARYRDSTSDWRLKQFGDAGHQSTVRMTFLRDHGIPASSDACRWLLRSPLD